jgi:hypothetical protein
MKDDADNIWRKIFGESTEVIGQGGSYTREEYPNILQTIAHKFRNIFDPNYRGWEFEDRFPAYGGRDDYATPQQESQYNVQPTPSSYAGSTTTPLATPTAMPTPTPMQPPDYNLTHAINTYGGRDAPLHRYSNVLEEATEKYPLFRNNPYLIPVIAHLETSSGRNITRPNNLINYGIRDPKINELFGRVGIEEAFRRSLREIGQTGSVYRRFDTNRPLTDEQIMEFGKTYEPMNEEYATNLLRGIRYIESQSGR